MPNRSDIIDTLSRFTPNGTGLNRDDLFFAAGRASAPRRTWWIVLAGVLALSQVATLVWFWPKPMPVEVPVTVPVAPPMVDAESPPLPPHSLAHVTQLFNQQGELVMHESSSDNLRPDQAPLSVRSRWIGE